MTRDQQPTGVDPAPGDLVFVLGGRAERARAAVALADRWSLPLVLSGESVVHGLEAGAASLAGPVLLVSCWPSTTRGELAGLRELLGTEPWRRPVVVTNDFHVRRTRLLAERAGLTDLALIGVATAGERNMARTRGREALGRLAARLLPPLPRSASIAVHRLPPPAAGPARTTAPPPQVTHDHS